MVSKFGKRVPTAVEDQATLGKTVLVPVWDEASRGAIRLAGRLATSDGGIVLAASFANPETPPTELKTQRHLTTQAEEWLAKEGLESRTLVSRRADGPRGPARDHAGRKRDAAGHRVAHARADRARQRGVRGARAHAGADPDGARRRRHRSNGSSSSCAASELVRPGRQDVELAAQLASRFAQNLRIGCRRRRARSGAASCSPARRTPIGSRPPIRSSGSGTTSRRRTSRSSRGWTPRATRWRASPR